MLHFIKYTIYANWPKNQLSQFYSGAINRHHALISISSVIEFQVSLFLDVIYMSRK
jgi:hypothetical protein